MTMPFRSLLLFLVLTTPALAQAPAKKGAPPSLPLPSVETLLGWLQTTKPAERAKAQAMLPEQISWPGESTIEKRDKQWGRQLYGKTPNAARDYEWLHRRVLILLAYHGSKAQSAVPVLLDWRTDGPADGAPPIVPGAPGFPVFPEDARNLNSALPPPPHRSGAALYALTFIAPDDQRVVDVLIAEWLKPNEEAGRALNRLGARDSLLKGLRRRPVEYLGIGAVGFIARFGPKAHDLVPQIVTYLGEENDNAARIAMGTLTKIGATSAEIEAALTQKLDDRDPFLQNAAFYGLVRFARNKPAMPATEALKTLGDWQKATPITLARAIVALANTPLDNSNVPLYMRVARQGPPDYLANQLWSIIERNRPGRYAPVVQVMIERHRESLSALQMEDKEALKPLQNALSHPKWEVKLAGLTGLAKLGPTAQPLRAAMEQVFTASIKDSKALPVRPQLLETARLLQMQNAIRPALLTWLDDSLKNLQTSSTPRDEDYLYHAHLIEALCESGKLSGVEQGALEKHVQQALAMDNVPVFIAATQLARLVKPPVASLLPRLQEVLSENFEGLSENQENQSVAGKRSLAARLAALRLVQTIGPEAQALAPRLREIIESRTALWIHAYDAARNALATVTSKSSQDNAGQNTPSREVLPKEALPRPTLPVAPLL